MYSTTPLRKRRHGFQSEGNGGSGTMLRGPLLALWTACHCERRLKKQEIAETDISETVQSILLHLLAETASEQQAASQQSLPLRVSGGLLVGVAKVYSKKLEIFAAECELLLAKMRNQRRRDSLMHGMANGGKMTEDMDSDDDSDGDDALLHDRKKNAKSTSKKSTGKKSAKSAAATAAQRRTAALRRRLLQEVDSLTLMGPDEILGDVREEMAGLLEDSYCDGAGLGSEAGDPLAGGWSDNALMESLGLEVDEQAGGVSQKQKQRHGAGGFKSQTGGGANRLRFLEDSQEHSGGGDGLFGSPLQGGVMGQQNLLLDHNTFSTFGNAFEDSYDKEFDFLPLGGDMPGSAEHEHSADLGISGGDFDNFRAMTPDVTNGRRGEGGAGDEDAWQYMLSVERGRGAIDPTANDDAHLNVDLTAARQNAKTPGARGSLLSDGMDSASRVGPRPSSAASGEWGSALRRLEEDSLDGGSAFNMTPPLSPGPSPGGAIIGGRLSNISVIPEGDEAAHDSVATTIVDDNYTQPLTTLPEDTQEPTGGTVGGSEVDMEALPTLTVQGPEPEHPTHEKARDRLLGDDQDSELIGDGLSSSEGGTGKENVGAVERASMTMAREADGSKLGAEGEPDEGGHGDDQGDMGAEEAAGGRRKRGRDGDAEESGAVADSEAADPQMGRGKRRKRRESEKRVSDAKVVAGERSGKNSTLAVKAIAKAKGRIEKHARKLKLAIDHCTTLPHEDWSERLKRSMPDKQLAGDLALTDAGHQTWEAEGSMLNCGMVEGRLASLLRCREVCGFFRMGNRVISVGQKPCGRGEVASAIYDSYFGCRSSEAPVIRAARRSAEIGLRRNTKATTSSAQDESADQPHDRVHRSAARQNDENDEEALHQIAEGAEGEVMEGNDSRSAVDETQVVEELRCSEFDDIPPSPATIADHVEEDVAAGGQESPVEAQRGEVDEDPFDINGGSVRSDGPHRHTRGDDDDDDNESQYLADSSQPILMEELDFILGSNSSSVGHDYSTPLRRSSTSSADRAARSAKRQRSGSATEIVPSSPYDGPSSAPLTQLSFTPLSEATASEYSPGGSTQACPLQERTTRFLSALARRLGCPAPSATIARSERVVSRKRSTKQSGASKVAAEKRLRFGGISSQLSARSISIAFFDTLTLKTRGFIDVEQPPPPRASTATPSGAAADKSASPGKKEVGDSKSRESVAFGDIFIYM